MANNDFPYAPLKRLAEFCRPRIQQVFVCACALTVGAFNIDWSNSAAVLLLVLGVTTCVHALRYTKNMPSGQTPRVWTRIGGWGMLVLSLWCVSAGLPFGTALLAALTGYVLFFLGAATGLRLLVPLAVLLILAPAQMRFNLYFSYPLRYLSSALTAALLRSFGLSVGWTGTDLSWDGEEIAITAACSGIEQLEALLFLGYILAVIMQKHLVFRICHFLLILPSLVLANVLRLTVTLLLFRRVGERIFDPDIHAWLGYGMVACTFLLLYLSGLLFRSLADSFSGEAASCGK